MRLNVTNIHKEEVIQLVTRKGPVSNYFFSIKLNKMALSKVKQSKRDARLKGRISEWERIPNDVRFSKKSGKPAFTKPGSNRK